MNRRAFMKVAAASTAWGMAATAETKPPLKCGLLGIDHAHGIDALKVLRASPDFEVVGICEPDPQVRAAFLDRRELEGLPWLSQDQLLGDPEVAMVAVESGVPRLLELGRAAVDAGKHLHLDKPAGTSLPEFEALLQEASRQGLLVQMGYMFRYNPGFDLIRRAVAEDWLGEVYAIQASMCTDLGADKRARMSFHPGGVMLELGCHLIDMIVLLKGEPKKVTPFLRHDGPFDDDLADNTMAVLEYDGALVKVEVGAMEPQAFAARRFKIVGPEGKIILSPLEPPVAQVVLKQPRGEFKAGAQQVALPDLERHVRDFEDLARCIRGDDQFAYPPRHDLAVQRTLLRACGEGFG
jgi:predicted dehydrogenase